MLASSGSGELLDISLLRMGCFLAGGSGAFFLDLGVPGGLTLLLLSSRDSGKLPEELEIPAGGLVVEAGTGGGLRLLGSVDCSSSPLRSGVDI